MAKRKGKSQHRLNWQQTYHAGEDTRQQFSHRAKLTQRAIKLQPARVQAELENIDQLDKCQGMVVGLYPGGVIVHCRQQELFCGIAKMFRAPEGAQHATAVAVGDEVMVALTQSHHNITKSQADKLRSDGFILSRQPRRTALCRPQPRSLKRLDVYETEIFEKVIVANMEVLLVVASTVKPSLRPALIDRFRIVAERGQLAAILVLNKVDLAMPDDELLGELRRLEMPMFEVSASTGQGLDDLTRTLAGRRSVLAGQSGVGKSTLVNAIVPGAGAATRTVREKDNRGRHTTAAASIYDLPCGGVIVDTPGVRELGMNLKINELGWYFPEFEQCSGQCKFNDCTHSHEPGCAVQAAVAENKILPRRYESYLRILETLEK